MRFSFLTRKKHGKQALTESESLGLGLKPGDPHYRAYVGPPQDYDLIAAMTFNLLTTLGLRQNHSLLDIGCGAGGPALRIATPLANQGVALVRRGYISNPAPVPTRPARRRP